MIKLDSALPLRMCDWSVNKSSWACLQCLLCNDLSCRDPTEFGVLGFAVVWMGDQAYAFIWQTCPVSKGYSSNLMVCWNVVIEISVQSLQSNPHVYPGY